MTTSAQTRHTDWQHWRDERDALATAPYGPAALIGTHWLDPQPLHIDGVPGEWIASDGRAVGTAPDFHLALAPGEEHRIGNLLLRTIIRAGQIALRVFDPHAATRSDLLGIDTFAYDPTWAVSGIRETTSAPLQLEHIDGFVSENTGSAIHLTLNARNITLEGTRTPDGGLQIVFADTTNGQQTQRFRFLTLPAPTPDGHTEIDFNRAHLPPCTFSDHFLCPLPPPANRLNFPILAGETRLRRG
ncbi:DUF1684 domain-containing protein [Nocardia macrotermitis]|uniref:DUF1684 domain-containing protein n=1 Tax=Nocardia macrotermitis TaxID=2585198 RepID=A0A7K0DBX1_9NOCA|nr:DUF1684 domain-containing protein [Nocardia macrotermitis]MQY22792.1 hypothetical protein [Nocardia macrotermitis]